MTQIIAPPTTVQAIHFGRVLMPVAIKYRPGFKFLLLLNSNLSVFDDHGMEAGLIGSDFQFRFILLLRKSTRGERYKLSRS